MQNTPVARPSDVELLYRINHALEHTASFEAAVDAGLDLIMRALGAESGTVWLLAEDRSFLYPYIMKGQYADALRSFKLPYGEGIAGWVVAHGKTEIIADCQADVRFSASADRQSGYITRTLLCAPLSTHAHCMGCVQIINKADGSPFCTQDALLCESFATLLATAIQLRGLALSIPERKALMVLENITKCYPQGKKEIQVLQSTNLTVYQHEFLIILGMSGAGKSTLLKILGGMEAPSTGRLSVDGKEYANASPHARAAYRREKIGFIFQSYNLMSNLTAYENIRLALEVSKKPLDAIDEVLGWVGLSDKRNSFPGQMSGGEQQRLAIARALAKKPDIILADEPTGALDEKTGKDVLLLLDRIAREKLGTVVMITHNASFAPIADRVIRMRSGRIDDVTYNPYPSPAKQWGV